MLLKTVQYVSLMMLGMITSTVGQIAAADAHLVYKAPTTEQTHATNLRRIGGAKGQASRGLVRSDGTHGSKRKSLNLDVVRALTGNSRSRKTAPAAPLPDYVVPLAPTHIGLSSVPSPTIYLYFSSRWPDNIRFTLTAKNEWTPLLRTQIPGPDRAGVLAIDLAEHNVKLVPGVEYEWVATLVNKASKERSADSLASAAIRYHRPEVELQKQLQAAAQQPATLYAAAGYFYDTVHALSRGKPPARAERAQLMNQVGLKTVAAYDNRRG